MTASAQAASGQTANASARFGTFGGVFTPNVLTILGLILFLRAGWVVGQAGLVGALMIVLIANSISFLTGLSLSAIATSMNVRAGGKYYLISRTLGREIGGAIGVPLYLSQAISVAFYIIGFTESLEGIAFCQPDRRQGAFDVDCRCIRGCGVHWRGLCDQDSVFHSGGADGGAAFILWGWLAFDTGSDADGQLWRGHEFLECFRGVFPGCDGHCGGREHVGRSEGPGAEHSQGHTVVGAVYGGGVFSLGRLAFVAWQPGRAEEQYAHNAGHCAFSAADPDRRVGGDAVVGAGQHSGGAARTLQAMANDGIVPRVLGSRLGSRTEPRVGVLITAGIAFAVIWAGDLNVVAPIITMFFLNTYGMTNLVAGIEKLVGNPSFRPRAKIHFSFSLLGAAGCYGAMFVINPGATVVAILISYGIYFYLERRSTIRTWGDVRSGIWFALARRSLLNLERSVFHAKNWRPNILVFTGQPHNRAPLVEIANLLSRGYGIVSFYQLLVGDIDQLAKRRLRSIARRQIRAYIQEQNMTAFAEADIVENFYAGAVTVSQSHGVGGLEPNAVLMGWSDTEGGRTLSLRLLSTLFELEKSVLFLHFDEKRGFGNKKVIDVWWRGRSGNGDLMLLAGAYYFAESDMGRGFDPVAADSAARVRAGNRWRRICGRCWRGCG